MRLKIPWILVQLLLLSVILTSCTGSNQAPQGMVLVKGGTFRMGSKAIFSDEEPVHRVTLNSFYIGKFEVTQVEWKAVMGNNPSLYKGDQYPVERVSWYDAVKFCNEKSKTEGLTPCYKGSGDQISCNFEADGYRLPTEAEWEYASRGGMNSLHYRYSGSNHAGEAGWYEVNSEDKTQPVGQKKPNETGIYDMSGNTREWCWDRYDKDYYKTSPPDNPKGPAPGKNRSYRGGGICDRIIWLRTTARFNLPPETKSCELGFRIIKKNTGNSNPPAGMVFVEGGAFNMGNNKGSSGEKLVHDVTVSSFYMGKFEVTQEEWKPVMGNNPSYRKGNPCPVNLINWYDAVEYCNKRSRKEGFKPCYSGSGDQIACNFDADGYRLPTEAEWEYAARGGIQSRHFKFSGSNDAGEVAWYLKNLIVYFQPVGEKKPNELGIYDMSGNMWEMCWDWYDIDYYKNSPAKNPKGPLSGIRRIIRGGSWLDPEDKLGCTLRSAIVPYRKAAHLGIRVVRTAK